jgi:CubicO group peptidase (beta-lactamase class C family)
MLDGDVRRCLEARFQRWSRERDLSGSVLVTQAGSTLFEGCYGLADRGAGVPVTRRTRFGLASVTKMFAAVAVADLVALVAAGRLRFDQSVVDVLSPQRRLSQLRPDVTLHHLLTHTSGIADYCEEDEDSPAHLGSEEPPFTQNRSGVGPRIWADLWYAGTGPASPRS